MWDAIVQCLKNDLLVVLRHLVSEKLVFRQQPNLNVADSGKKARCSEQERGPEMLVGTLFSSKIPSDLGRMWVEAPSSFRLTEQEDGCASNPAIDRYARSVE